MWSFSRNLEQVHAGLAYDDSWFTLCHAVPARLCLRTTQEKLYT